MWYVACMGNLKENTVHTFVMCPHFPDVCTLHLMVALWIIGYCLFSRLLIIAQPKVCFQNK